jgi:hypothetical protein
MSSISQILNLSRTQIIFQKHYRRMSIILPIEKCHIELLWAFSQGQWVKLPLVIEKPCFQQ